MSKTKRAMLWIWCFPQQLLGLLVRIFTRARDTGEGYYVWGITSGSISLGTFIFLCPAHEGDEKALRHEQGHARQSFMLGWLYLFVIGIPSIIWAGCFKGYRKKNNISYYSFYTERWADKLGGVER